MSKVEDKFSKISVDNLLGVNYWCKELLDVVQFLSMFICLFV